VCRNLQHRSLLTVFSATSAPPFQPLHQRNVCHPVVNRFKRKTPPIVNRKYFFMNILCIELFCQQKTHNRTLLFGSTHLKHGRHFYNWNQPLNIHIPVWYLDSHEAVLCCYPVIDIKNLLHPLQLFYFHLWHIYWLSLVYMLIVRDREIMPNVGWFTEGTISAFFWRAWGKPMNNLR
jgi:hypothetical protein